MNKMNLPAPFGAVTPTPPIVSKTVYNNHIILTTVQMVRSSLVKLYSECLETSQIQSMSYWHCMYHIKIRGI